MSDFHAALVHHRLWESTQGAHMRRLRVGVLLTSLSPLVLGGCATTKTTGRAESGPAAPPRSMVRPLLTETLPESVGREVRLLTVEYPPGAVTPPHHHPGAVFVYVVKGAVLC